MGKFGAALGLMAAGLAAGSAGAECSPGKLELRSATGSVMRLSVEIADSASERAQGLMDRPALATSAGMLFVYDTPQHARFWMRNTLIPLDMIFADATGLVTRVHSNAVPLDDTAIDGGEGVTFVLEINGGLAVRLGIGPGAAFRHPAIAQGAAVWPCD